MTQREIAKKQGRSQASISRAIATVEQWTAMLAEDRRGLTWFERFRAGLARHRIYLEHLMDIATKQFERSCETITVKRTRTKVYPEGHKADGKLVTETVTDECPKEQYGRMYYVNFLNKVAREIALLDGGWISPGNTPLACENAIDTEERDRWERLVKHRDAKIVELQQTVAELQSKLGAGLKASETPVAVPKDADLQPAEKDESEIDLNHPVLNQNSPVVNAATPGAGIVCDERDAGPGPQPPSAPKVNQGANVEGPHDPATPGPSEPGYWEDCFRQEALDYHCLIRGLPPASLEQATGIPHPFKMSPRMWIEKGFPYMIHIDDSIPCDRVNPLDNRRTVKLACPVAHPTTW